jgi:hypothetical protein
MLLAVALAMAAGHGAAGCTCAGERDELAAVKQDIRASLNRALGLHVQSITCAEGNPAPARDCLVEVRGQDSFIVEVVDSMAAGDPGALQWKLRGHRNIEYQLALGMIEQVRNQPERVVCPEAGDLAQGFECQVVFSGGIDTAVAISAGERADRFEWVARSILMPGVIEARIAEDVSAAGEQAQVSCGSELRRIIAGSSFECAIVYGGGGSGGGSDVAEVSVIDDQGHVQYRLRKGAE